MPGFVLLGPPASGKGTQGRRLAEEHGWAYFSTGKQLRRELEDETPLGVRARPFLEQGHYVPDDLALALALGWLRTVDGGWVLDGFPRTVAQAEDLDAFLRPDEGEVRAILLDAPREELEQRVAGRRECLSCSWVGTRVEAEQAGACPACGGELGVRPDDDLERFRRRHREFGEWTVPVADYYQSSGRLQSIDGRGSPEEVFQRIQSQLD